MNDGNGGVGAGVGIGDTSERRIPDLAELYLSADQKKLYFIEIFFII
jgi:hypothetical protein